MIWYRVYVVACDDVVLRQGTIPWRCCRKDRVGAEVVRAASAVVAVSAGDAGFDGYSVPGFDVLNGGTGFDDGA